jgi:anti-sigma regulatory factor (Ser/Thr protein kinase)
MMLSTMSANDHNALQITLSNRIGYEKIAIACSASFAELYGFPGDRIEDLKTIVGEATTNAIRHGNKGRQDAKVVLSMRCDADTIYVSVMDEGSGLDQLPPDPDIDRIIESGEKTIGGFGLYLIRQLADEVEFIKRADNGHAIQIALNMKAQVDDAENE